MCQLRFCQNPDLLSPTFYRFLAVGYILFHFGTGFHPFWFRASEGEYQNTRFATMSEHFLGLFATRQSRQTHLAVISLCFD